MDAKELKGFVEFIIKNNETFQPLVKLAVKTIKTYASEIRPLIEDGFDYMIDRRIANIKKLEENGFTKDQAIAITNDERLGFQYWMKNYRQNQNR